MGPAEFIDVNGQTYCITGTYGLPLLIAGVTHLLSNAHVLAREGSTPAGTTTVDIGPGGDKILQPGPADTGCIIDTANDTVGTLADFVGFDTGPSAVNTVDAAIAASATSSISDATPADGYGRVKSAIEACTGPSDCSNLLGLDVQKYGRTTGLTKGTIVAIGATINVGYDTGTVTFSDQITVDGKRVGFLKSGDSGARLVTDPGRNPVGLLFASNRSGKTAIANRIELVLEAFPGATVSGE